MLEVSFPPVVCFKATTVLSLSSPCCSASSPSPSSLLTTGTRCHQFAFVSFAHPGRLPSATSLPPQTSARCLTGSKVRRKTPLSVRSSWLTHGNNSHRPVSRLDAVPHTHFHAFAARIPTHPGPWFIPSFGLARSRPFVVAFVIGVLRLYPRSFRLRIATSSVCYPESVSASLTERSECICNADQETKYNNCSKAKPSGRCTSVRRRLRLDAHVRRTGSSVSAGSSSPSSVTRKVEQKRR